MEQIVNACNGNYEISEFWNKLLERDGLDRIAEYNDSELKGLFAKTGSKCWDEFNKFLSYYNSECRTSEFIKTLKHITSAKNIPEIINVGAGQSGAEPVLIHRAFPNAKVRAVDPFFVPLQKFFPRNIIIEKKEFLCDYILNGNEFVIGSPCKGMEHVVRQCGDSVPFLLRLCSCLHGFQDPIEREEYLCGLSSNTKIVHVGNPYRRRKVLTNLFVKSTSEFTHVTGAPMESGLHL